VSDICGITLSVASDTHDYGELRKTVEERGREVFVDRYGFEPDKFHWGEDLPYQWEDPETGHTYDMPGGWVLLIEGVRT
jgi:hypothetical protein